MELLILVILALVLIWSQQDPPNNSGLTGVMK